MKFPLKKLNPLSILSLCSKPSTLRTSTATPTPPAPSSSCRSPPPLLFSSTPCTPSTPSYSSSFATRLSTAAFASLSIPCCLPQRSQVFPPCFSRRQCSGLKPNELYFPFPTNFLSKKNSTLTDLEFLPQHSVLFAKGGQLFPECSVLNL